MYATSWVRTGVGRNTHAEQGYVLTCLVALPKGHTASTDTTVLVRDPYRIKSGDVAGETKDISPMAGNREHQAFVVVKKLLRQQIMQFFIICTLNWVANS